MLKQDGYQHAVQIIKIHFSFYFQQFSQNSWLKLMLVNK